LPAPPADTAAAYEIERFPRIPVDRDDPIGIYRVAHEAVQRARIGYGPTLVDCVAWPLAQRRDPLSKLKSHIPGRPQSRQKVLEHQLSAELKSGTDAPEPAVALFAAQ
jgi:hypothetical protein